MPVISIEQIGEREGQEATLRGWIYQKRSSGKLRFLVLRDGTGYLQMVAFKKEKRQTKRDKKVAKVRGTVGTSRP